MATTARDIIVAAYARSSKNRPGSLATDATELLAVLARALRGLFAVGVKVNPEFFGASADVNFAGAGWKRPADAESVLRIEFQADKREVVVVPFSDRSAEPALPAVYRMGQTYRSAGNASDPVNETLTFHYAKRADVPVNLDAAIDPLWPESYNELLISQVAIYLALKDGRADEAAALADERNNWLKLFVAFLQDETANERKRFAHVRQVNIDSLVALVSVGGAA